MDAVKMSKKYATVVCPDCERSFRANVGNKDIPWQSYVFKCPVCNEMKCVPRSEIIE